MAGTKSGGKIRAATVSTDVTRGRRAPLGLLVVLPLPMARDLLV